EVPPWHTRPNIYWVTLQHLFYRYYHGNFFFVQIGAKRWMVTSLTGSGKYISRSSVGVRHTHVLDRGKRASQSFMQVPGRSKNVRGASLLGAGGRALVPQFEREIAGERIRDKIAASKAKGMWMGGNVPLGYALIGIAGAMVIDVALFFDFSDYRAAALSTG